MAAFTPTWRKTDKERVVRLRERLAETRLTFERASIAYATLPNHRTKEARLIRKLLADCAANITLLDAEYTEQSMHIAEVSVGAEKSLNTEARRKTRRQPSPSWVYFVKSRNLVKIGRAKDPYARMLNMQTANGQEIAILGVMPGGAAEESDLHGRFHSDWVQGEWFRLSDAIKTYIAENCHG